MAKLRYRSPQWRRASSGISFSLILFALKDAAVKAYHDNCIGLAKEAAYSFILSFFPMLLSLIVLFFLLGDTTRSVAEISITLSKVLPADSQAIVANYISLMAARPPTRLLWISLAGTLWTSSGMMMTLHKSFNIIYEVRPYWGFWLRRFVAILLVIAVGIPLAISTVVTIFAQQVERQLEFYLSQYFSVDLWWVWVAARWLIVIITTVAIAALLYRVGGEQQKSWRGVLPGALLATGLWLGVTLLFNRYVQNFGSYNRIYGGLGAVIVLLVWMFLTTLSLLYGAEFNFQFARRRGRWR
ncbi:MAG: YihY/virulence factor BrkB family protein [Acidobacteriota bacterium]